MISRAALLLVPLLLAAQGTEPKSKASDYPAHASLEKLALGAEYLVHSFRGNKQTFVARDYLVVEVGVYPAKDQTAVISHGQFGLRINGKKFPIQPQAPGFVAASLKYPDWEQRPNLEVGAGPVILGRPEPVERFPGDQRPRQGRLPQPPKTSESDPNAAPSKADEVAVAAALPEIEARGPVSGFLYFAHKGKMKSLKSLELVYTGPDGPATLKLL